MFGGLYFGIQSQNALKMNDGGLLSTINLIWNESVATGSFASNVNRQSVECTLIAQRAFTSKFPRHSFVIDWLFVLFRLCHCIYVSFLPD